MINYFSKLIVAIALVIVTVTGAIQVSAQNISMPVLYDAQGNEVNTSNDGSSLPAGTYYTTANGTGEVYYYGNGNYYDPLTMTYWGTTSSTNGAAGTSIMNLGQVLAQNTDSGTVTTPGVPNTGAGGNAALNWSLLVGGVIALSMITYAITRESRTA